MDKRVIVIKHLYSTTQWLRGAPDLSPWQMKLQLTKMNLRRYQNRGREKTRGSKWCKKKWAV